MNDRSARRILLSAFVAAVSTLTAAASPIQVNLVSPGTLIDPSITIDGTTIKNVFIGPYTLSLNGQDVAGMCVDFGIDTPLNASWTANATVVGSSNLSNTYSPTEGQEYQEEAYLFSQIIQPGADRTDIQIAAWNIMAYSITNSSYTSSLGDNSYIDAALANYGSINDNDFLIISDTTIDGVQEFIVGTPEPSSFLLMLAPALMGAEAVRRRRLNASLS